PAPHPPRGFPEGPGPAIYEGSGDGEALRRGDGDEPGDPGRTATWRLRVHARVRRRALLPGRQDHRDLRGHVGDPAARDREPAPPGGGRPMTKPDRKGRPTEREPERPIRFSTVSDMEIAPLYTAEDLPAGTAERIGLPGEFPYTRGVYPSMY